MKTRVIFYIAILGVFSFNCFAQLKKSTPANAVTADLQAQSDNAAKDGLVIESYYVEETINMTFGKRIIKYEVSKLSMVNTYDLGPNNTRVVTPKYRKAKVKSVEAGLQSKTLIDTAKIAIRPVKVEVIPQPDAPKYVIIDIVSTYAKVLDKGYKSTEMLTKVADRYYFDGNMALAAKYYSELFTMATNLDPVYYTRYVDALKATNQIEKANETILSFENKNTGNHVVKQNKLVKN